MRRLVLATLFAALTAPAVAQEVNIYSSRHYDTDERLYADFTDATGIEVNRIEGTTDELIARLKAEGRNSPADILLTVDAGRIWLADREGLLQPIQSETLDSRIPAEFRHPDDHWFGFSTRARIIFHSKSRVPNPPATYEALADPEWKGRICIRSAMDVYNLSLMSAIIAHDGEAKARDWAAGVLANLARPPEGADLDQIRGIISGQCDIAVVNTYYFARTLGEKVPGISGESQDVGWVFPNQETTGTHVNIAAAGIVINSPNKDAAVKFLEYLTTDQAQAYFANQNYEFPVVQGVKVSEIAASLGEFRRDTLNLSALGENQPKAQAIFNEVGFP